VIWTSAAFVALDEIYGSTTTPSRKTSPSNVVSNADITRLINSSEIQVVLSEPKGYNMTKGTGILKKTH
jgi:large subunit ribosomal protein L4e